MADTVVTLDSQAQWETADRMAGCVAVDPAGKLTLATDSEALGDLNDDNQLAVYCRCREGTGTTLENVGEAGNGIYAPGAWGTRTDGRHYLTGGSASVAYHASMALADDNGSKYNLSAGLIFRLSAVTAQVFMQRANRFKLGIDSNGKPYASYYDENGAWQTIAGPTAILADTWYELAMIYRYGSLGVYLDGSLVASLTGVGSRDDPGSGALSVQCAGNWTDFFLIGDGTSGVSILSQARSAIWEKKWDLTTRHSVRHIDTIADRTDYEHSISVAIVLADSEEDLDHSPGYNWSLPDGTKHLYPGETGLSSGRYAKVVVTMSCRNWHRSLPLFDKLVVTFREACAPLETWKREMTLDYVSLRRREGALPETIPETLDVVYRELARIERNFGVLNAGFGALGDEVRELTGSRRESKPFIDNLGMLGLSNMQDMLTVGIGARGALGVASVEKNQADINTLYGNLMDNLKWIVRLEERLQALESAGYATEAYVDAADAVIQGDLDTHKIATTNTHGITSPDDICGEAYANQNIIDHLGSGTAHFSQVGQSGYDHAHDVGDPHASAGYATEAWAASEATTQIGIHAADTTTHGCTSNIADQVDISAHANLTSNVHGISGADDIAGRAYVDYELADHANDTTYVHGVGSSPVCSENEAGDLAIYYVGLHAGICTNYAT